MELRILGSVGVAEGDRWIWLRSSRVRTVLSALVLNAGSAVSADELILAVWGDGFPRTAANQIQIVVSTLRSILAQLSPQGDAVVVTQPPGYVIAVPADGRVTCDVEEFRGLVDASERSAGRGDWVEAHRSCVAALAMWRGRACQDIDSPHLQPLVTALDQKRQAVIEKRLSLEILLGRPAEVASEVGRFIALDPMRERLWYLLMFAQAALGQQAAALDTYRRARRIFVAELGVEPGAEMRELERAVLVGDLWKAAREIERWVAPGIFQGRRTASRSADTIWPPPRQLPAGTPDFVGRLDENARIASLIAGSSSLNSAEGAVSQTALRVISISGRGGVGKTTLAIRAARRAEHLFPDGCLFVDLRGSDPVPPDPHVILGTLLRSLGFPGTVIPDEPEARLGLYRSVIAQRRLLVVLDNAAADGQVAPLLPGAGDCVVLVTSRRRLAALEGVHHVELDEFAVSEAVGLLAVLAGAERIRADEGAAQRIVALCDRLPLAVRLVGMRLQYRKDMLLARMAERLADERDRLDEMATGGREIRAGIGLSIAQLDGDAAIMLRRLAILPVPGVQPWLAAAVQGVRIAHADRLLERLGQASLLSEDHVGGESLFRPHDLIRLYAREQADAMDPPSERAAALRRAYDTLLRIARHADHLLGSVAYPMPEPLPAQWISPDVIEAGVGDPTTWFEGNRDLIVGATRDAVRHDWLDLAWHLVVTLAHVSGTGTYDREWLAVMKEVLGALQHRASDAEHAEGQILHGEAAVLLALGGLVRQRGDPAQAHVYLRRARLLYRRTGDAYRAAVTAIQLAMSARAMGRRRMALAAIGYAIMTFQRCERVRHDGWAYLTLGNLMMDERVNLAAAGGAYRHALTAMRGVGEVTGETNVLVCLGILRDHEGRQDEAAEYLRAGHDIADRTDNLFARVQIETRLAQIEMRRGQLTEAWRWMEFAFATARLMRDARAESRVLRVRADLLVLLGRPTEAVAAAQAALAAAMSVVWPLEQAEAEFSLAQAHHAAGDLESAHCAGLRSVERFTAIKHLRRSAVVDWLAALPRAKGGH